MRRSKNIIFHIKTWNNCFYNLCDYFGQVFDKLLKKLFLQKNNANNNN